MANVGLIKRNSYLLIGAIFLVTLCTEAVAQEPPPRPPKIYLSGQELTFGAFTYGTSGGTVTVTESGSRSASGDVILLGLGYLYTAGSYLIEANPGTVISVIFNNVGPLVNGTGGSMDLQITGSSPVSPFVTDAVPPATTTLTVGGELTVGNATANPPGSYSGTFDIILVVE